MDSNPRLIKQVLIFSSQSIALTFNFIMVSLVVQQLKILT